ncbi:MAG: serine/threonine protein kinase [bacterium]|nr:serine/threonine protein kinase [bacterium]
MNDPNPLLSEAEILFADYQERVGADGTEPFEDFLEAHPDHARFLRQLASDEAATFHAGLAPLGEALPLSADEPWNDDATREVIEAIREQRDQPFTYELREELGRGGMGVVRRAFDPVLRRDVAIKFIRRELFARDSDAERGRLENVLHRFVSEAQICAQLQHPGVVPILDFGMDHRGQLYFVMPIVEGDTVASILGERRQDWTSVLAILQRVLETLAYAHERGVVHRDLKPANVMVGEFGAVYVLDWGLAALREAEIQPVTTARAEADAESLLKTAPGRVPGTVYYMSPEQAAGDADRVDARTDVYAAGAILYQLLTGRLPHGPAEGEDESRELAEVRDAVANGQLVPIEQLARGVPAELISICQRAMALERDERYASARSMADDIRAFLEGRVVRAHRTGPIVELVKWGRRNRIAAFAAGFAVVLAAVAAQQFLQNKFARAEERFERGQQQALNEQRRAEERAESDRKMAAEVAISAAELASQRGQWDRALGFLESARRSGHENLDYVRLLESDALVGQGKIPESYAIVDELIESTEDRKVLGMAKLRAGTRVLVPTRDQEAGLRHLRESLDFDLSEGERAHVRSLLADDTQTALSLAQEAVEKDPYSHSAHSNLIGLLTLTGHWQRAVDAARFFETYFPEDPTPVMVYALAAAAAGNGKQASKELRKIKKRVGRDSYKVVASGVNLLSSAPENVGRAALGVPMSPFFILKVTQFAKSLGNTEGGVFLPVVPMPPVVRKVYGPAWELMSIAMTNLNNPGRFYEQMRILLPELTAKTNDGFFHGLHGFAVMPNASDYADLREETGSQEKFRAVLRQSMIDTSDTFWEAAVMPSVLPGSDRSNDYMNVILISFFLKACGPDDPPEQVEQRGMLAERYELLARRAIQREGTSSAEYNSLMGYAIMARQPTIALDLARVIRRDDERLAAQEGFQVRHVRAFTAAKRLLEAEEALARLKDTHPQSEKITDLEGKLSAAKVKWFGEVETSNDSGD